MGALVDAAGLCWLSTLGPGTPIGLLLCAYVSIIVDQAMMWTPLFAASLGVLDRSLLAHGSAIVNTLHQLAGAAGIAITFSIMGTASAILVEGGEAVGPAMARGAQQAYLACCGLALVALLAACFLPRPATAGQAATAR